MQVTTHLIPGPGGRGQKDPTLKTKLGLYVVSQNHKLYQLLSSVATLFLPWL